MYGTLKSDVLGLRMNTFKDRRLNVYKLIKPLIAKKKQIFVHLLNLYFCSLNKQSLLILIILIILIILTIR